MGWSGGDSRREHNRGVVLKSGEVETAGGVCLMG